MFDCYKIKWGCGTKSIVIKAYDKDDALEFVKKAFGDRGFANDYKACLASSKDIEIFKEATDREKLIETENFKSKLGFTQKN